MMGAKHQRGPGGIGQFIVMISGLAVSMEITGYSSACVTRLDTPEVISSIARPMSYVCGSVECII